MADRQKEIDFEGASIYALIDAAVFPADTRAPASVAAALRAIAFLTTVRKQRSMEEIASQMKASYNTARRAIAESERIGVLLVQREIGFGGRGPSKYEIDRERLFSLRAGAAKSIEKPPPIAEQARAQFGQTTAQIEQRARAQNGRALDLTTDLTVTENKEEGAPAAAGWPPGLRELAEWWNRLHAEGLVSSAANAEKPSAVLLANWKRLAKFREQKALLDGLQAVEQAIRESEFCREPWFDLAKLLGRNSDREWIVERLLAGKYRGRQREKPNRDTRPRESATFDPARPSDF